MKILLNIVLPISIFLVFTLAYFKPAVFDGKSFQQHDNQQATGMQKEIQEYRKQDPNQVLLWTNQAFLGMPTYQVWLPKSGNIPAKLNRYARLNTSITDTVPMFFLFLLVFFISCCSIGIPPSIATVITLSAGFMTNNLDILEAGHSTKFYSMIYTMPMIAAAITAFRGKWLLGSSAFGFLLAIQLSGSHIQVTYYTLLIIGFIGLGKLIETIFKGEWPKFAKSALGMAVALVLGIGANLQGIWTTYEYSEESIRGKTELKNKKVNSSTQPGKKKSAPKDGLSKDYIFQYSFEKLESFTLILPNAFGGSSNVSDAGTITSRKRIKIKKTRLGKALKKLDPQLRERAIRYSGGYWGKQPMVGAPYYTGALFFFLVVLGLIVIRSKLKWGLLASFFFLLILAWGKHFASFNNLMVDYFPFYNKFRAVTMSMTVGQLLLPVLMGWALMELFKKEKLEQRLAEKQALGGLRGLNLLRLPTNLAGAVLFAGIISCLVCLLGWLLISINADFIGKQTEAFASSLADGIAQQYQQQTGQAFPSKQLAEKWYKFFEVLHEERSASLNSSLWRSCGFILLGTGITWAYVKNYFNKWLFIGAIGVCGMIDIVSIDLAYVNEDSFRDKKEQKVKEHKPTSADQFVLNQNDKSEYRVLDIARMGAPNQNADGLHFHKSVGGYFAAKPMRYQEVYDRYNYGEALSGLVRQIIGQQIKMFSAQTNRNPSKADYDRISAGLDGYIKQVFPNEHILDMYNVKYIIHDEDMNASVNSTPCGNAWFVDSVRTVADADAELAVLGDFNPHTTAIVQEKFNPHLEGVSYGAAQGSIQLKDYHPNEMVYAVNTNQKRLAVFSEIYYPPSKGWKVYIDGQEVEGGFIKVNYLLRGLVIPAGAKEVRMEFAPKSYYQGSLYAYIASTLLLLGLGLGIFFSQREYRKNKT